MDLEQEIGASRHWAKASRQLADKIRGTADYFFNDANYEFKQTDYHRARVDATWGPQQDRHWQEVDKSLEKAWRSEEAAECYLDIAHTEWKEAREHEAKANNLEREVRWGLPDMSRTGVDIPDLTTDRGRRLAAREILLAIADRISVDL